MYLPLAQTQLTGTLMTSEGCRSAWRLQGASFRSVTFAQIAHANGRSVALNLLAVARVGKPEDQH